MDGLSSEEVQDRIRSGLVNKAEVKTSRSYTDIIVKNVVSPMNIILFIIGAALFLLEEYMSALSATGIISVNILISTIQEMRAKRRLDKISLLTRPKVTVIRDGKETVIAQEEIVKDDLIIIRAGEQALVDGSLISATSLEMDESLLTGESSTVRKKEGDVIYSGSICITGEGRFIVTAFGNDSLASQMLNSAKKFTSKKTPLEMETTTITTALMVIAFTLLAIAIIVELIRGGVSGFGDLTQYLEIFVICLDIVPVALFLLITITYMMAAIRMANTGVLLQRFNSVESISHVDTVCMDKTGTITTNNLVFDSAEHLIDQVEAERLITMFANSTGSKNKTIKAIIDQYGEVEYELVDEIQFSSARKFSAVKVRVGDVNVSMYTGAWNILRPHVKSPETIDAIIERQSECGLRTIVICRSEDGPFEVDGEYVIYDLEPISVISIRDEVRPDCRETIDVFLQNGMDLKVISGDDPITVESLFRLADIPGERNIISGPELDALSDSEYDEVVLKTNIFGRMKPENKEKVIEVLKRNGRYVAMIGDGVNDVKSLKSAQVGVALESGSGAARGVADMILVDDNFNALPKALVEGRRTISGIRDILKIYISRNMVVAFMFIAIFLFIGNMPMLPVQNMVYAFIAVTVIAFFMTIFAKPDENKELILPDVLRFAIPSAITISVVSVLIYCVVWNLTANGDLVWDVSYLQGVADLRQTTIPDFIDTYLSADSVYDPDYPSSYADILARTSMVLTAATVGVLQLLIVCPFFKFLSMDGKTNKRILPLFLVVLLITGICAFYAFIPEVFAVFGMALLPTLGFEIVAVAVVITFFTILLLVKRNIMHGIVEMFEKWYLKKLEKEYTKGDVVNEENMISK
jgi:cation-transporting ATPase E